MPVLGLWPMAAHHLGMLGGSCCCLSCAGQSSLVVEVDGAEGCDLREDDVDASIGVTP